MREIRPSGSEGGEAELNRPSLPLFIKRPYGTNYLFQLVCNNKGVALAVTHIFY